MNSTVSRLSHHTRYDCSPDTPRWLPRLFMMTADTETYFPIRLETTIWGCKAETRRPQRICRRENYSTVIEALTVHRVRGTTKSKVPFKKVRFERLGGIVSGGRFGHFSGLAHLKHHCQPANPYPKIRKPQATLCGPSDSKSQSLSGIEHLRIRRMVGDFEFNCGAMLPAAAMTATQE